MTFGSSFCKKGHCIHILWCIFMGLGHNDPWVESHMWPQQMWGQRPSSGQWPLVQVFAKRSLHILWCIFRRDSWFENHLVYMFVSQSVVSCPLWQHQRLQVLVYPYPGWYKKYYPHNLYVQVYEIMKFLFSRVCLNKPTAVVCAKGCVQPLPLLPVIREN